MCARIKPYLLSVGIIPLGMVSSMLNETRGGEHESLAVLEAKAGAPIQSVSCGSRTLTTITSSTWCLTRRACGSTTAHFNGEELFTYGDETFGEAGSCGVWCKPNNTTYFDDLKADIFAGSVAILGPFATEG